MSVKLDV